MTDTTSIDFSAIFAGVPGAISDALSDNGLIIGGVFASLLGLGLVTKLIRRSAKG